MRREGRQHGLVLTVEPAASPQPPSRQGRLLVDASVSPPTTGFRTRVPARPTNHSKYTGRAPSGLRQMPFSKSRDKSKGSRKLRDLDIGLNPRLASWRVAGGSPNGWALAIGGGSASAAAVYLSGYPLGGEKGGGWDCMYDEHKRLDEDYGGGGEEEAEEMEEVGGIRMITGAEEEEEEEEGGEGGEEGGAMELEEVDDDGGGDEEDMGFCEVWYVWDYVDEEDWCVLGEMEM